MVKHTVYDYDHYWQADAFFLPVEKRFNMPLASATQNI
jgi:hypothetical protein